ncbi:hypothetical protein CBR_g34950 [Chara braunii]|uniref:Uncharacterized protein n=1 Tax=Chara braunii TaxID=69332 RepID=A0A388LJR7_CHABU|nr:hypothetical protein CBR_g34950 [Chara braunii]|eukprot:GBG82574.1 hypothetical protein CBR_g34950 [Chara braunii]
MQCLQRSFGYGVPILAFGAELLSSGDLFQSELCSACGRNVVSGSKRGGEAMALSSREQLCASVSCLCSRLKLVRVMSAVVPQR